MFGQAAITFMALVVGSGLVVAKPVVVTTAVHVHAYADENTGWLGVYLGSQKDGREGVSILGFVGEDNPAQSAGLEENDVIIGFEGDEVSNLESLVNAIKSSSPGQKVNIDIDRDGKEMTYEVTLGTRPDKMELKALGNYGFSWSDKGPSRAFRWRAHGLPGELHEILGDIDVGIGNLKIEIACEDGVGTATVEHDGEVETHEFDCGGDWDSAKSFMFRMDDDMHFDFESLEDKMQGVHRMLKLKMPQLDFDFGDLEDHHFVFKGMPGMAKKLHAFHLRQSANTRFNVESDGHITVTVTKNGSELTLNFRDADDLQDSRPELYEKYEDLILELE